MHSIVIITVIPRVIMCDVEMVGSIVVNPVKMLKWDVTKWLTLKALIQNLSDLSEILWFMIIRNMEVSKE